jgi:hypothetical protein
MPGARAWAPIVAVLQWAVDVKGYPANNWQNAPSTDRYRDAFARHFAAWQDDPRGVDSESGLSHLSHAVCNGLFLLWHGDDRPVEPTVKIELMGPDMTASLVVDSARRAMGDDLARATYAADARR